MSFEPASWADKAREAIKAKSFPAAIMAAQRLSIWKPSDPTGYALHGNAYIRDGVPKKAIPAFKRTALLKNNQDLGSRHNLAMALDLADLTQEAATQYQSLMTLWPDTPGLAQKLIKVLFRLESFKLCLAEIGRLTEIDLEILYIRGACHSKMGNARRGITHLDIVIEKMPGLIQAQEAKAEGLIRLNRCDEAIEILNAARPHSANPAINHYALARAELKTKQFGRARTSLKTALIHSPDLFGAARQLAYFYRDRKEPKQAQKTFRRALILLPTSEILHKDYIECCHKLGDKLAAVRGGEEFLKGEPISSSMWNDVAIIMKECRNRPVAVRILRRALGVFKTEPVIAYNLGHTLNEESRGTEAIGFLKRALVFRPDYPRAWSAMSVCQLMDLRHEYAYQMVMRALAGDPNLASGWLNKAIVLRTEGRLQESIEACRHALELRPDDPIGLPNIAYTLLMAGEIEQGFRAYDYRWLRPDFPSARRPFKQPIWQGEALKNEGVLVYMEQGMGDELMFAWYLHLFTNKTNRIAVECDPRLADLFVRSFPEIEFIARREIPDPRTAAPDLHYKLPVGHIPKFYWYDLRRHINRVSGEATRPINRSAGHLVPNPDRQAHWREYLDTHGGERVKVGICWRSSVHSRDRDRQYLTPTQIASLFDERFAVYNLQYDHIEEETDPIAASCAETGALFATPPEIDLRNDLEDLTALCSEMDLVVTPLISTAFMAGAVGTPVWVFRSNEAGCTWHMMGTDFVPWFPSMRLFFRNPQNPWDETITRFKSNLNDVVLDSDHSQWRLGKYPTR
jgi:tetratricopeptide (TPR) repeat protein